MKFECFKLFQTVVWINMRQARPDQDFYLYLYLYSVFLCVVGIKLHMVIPSMKLDSTTNLKVTRASYVVLSMQMIFMDCIEKYLFKIEETKEQGNV